MGPSKPASITQRLTGMPFLITSKYIIAIQIALIKKYKRDLIKLVKNKARSVTYVHRCLNSNI